mmetsp:Transcript_1638/g.2772  ORF Transcript_1638/g.2772 Transcript_1638/m.2772 type:complete len:341 (+) Transcript_1638:403-1425(+)
MDKSYYRASLGFVVSANQGAWTLTKPSLNLNLQKFKATNGSMRTRTHSTARHDVSMKLSTMRPSAPKDDIDAQSQTQTQTQAATKNAKKKTGRAAELHTDGDTLLDEPKHILLCATTAAISAINLAQVIQTSMSSSATTQNQLMVCLAVFVAYVFADFASGVYHWAVDNYGDRDTPVFGYQIDAFQGHHKSPWTITERGTFNNLHRACVPAIPLLFLLALLNNYIPTTVQAFGTTFLVSVVMAQEIHKWAHMIEPPKWVKVLQDLKLLLGRRDHGLHHTSPFEHNYCIVSGWCNSFLDKTGFFRFLEAFFHQVNGSKPIAWMLDSKVEEDASKFIFFRRE